ncbi:amidohydrolase family protein [Paenibacillus gansuensis]|uniref:Amidohydrolase family protein n=1 Tax=Paenibacillus gansuensis TaxID=306542 RepID=A0ABW5PDF6_9BACL
MNNTKEQLASFIAQTPIFSTHEHHRDDDFYADMSLNTLFSCSYVGWYTAPPAPEAGARAAWLEKIRCNSYFVWLEKSVCSIYGEEEITPDNWDSLSEKIRRAHQEPGYHIRLLQEKAGYIRFLEDCYWNTGSDVGYPDMVTAVYRLDMWMQGFHPESVDHDGCNPHANAGYVIPDLDTYLGLLREELVRRRPSIAGLKCASAYQRTIRFQTVTREQAEALYLKHPSELSQEEQNRFGDYILDAACRIAEELDLPIQIHTGLALLEGSNPLNLEGLIASHPGNKFVLFHGGFPWIHETAGLAHNYQNVLIDINWLPLISTSAAVQALHMYIEVLPNIHTLAWGGDTWTSEEAVGASMAFRHVLTRVLSEKVDQGYFTLKQAEQLAEKIMYKNAQNIYNIIPVQTR